MGRISTLFTCVVVAAVVASASAQNVTISGNLKYTDLGGGTFDLRGVTVELYDSNTLLDSLLSTTLLGNNGSYSFTVPIGDTEALGGNIDPYIRVILDNAGGVANGYDVYDDDTLFDPTYEDSTTPVNNIAGNTTINVTYGPAGTFNEAAAIFDQMVQGDFGAGVIRPGLPSVNNQLRVDYPDGGNGAFYNNNEINIGSHLPYAWDVNLHEYGHYMSDLDNLDNSPGGAHSFGQSNITHGQALGKDGGTRLAWGEGLATYLSLAIQDVGGFNQPAIPTVGDTTYTHRSNVGGEVFTVPVEGNDGFNRGEGDESPVMRILWDLADGKNEAHDAIEIGHADLYDNLDNIGGLVRLDQVWDHFFANTAELELTTGTVDAKRTLLGDIFEEYDVSPDPAAFGAPVNIVTHLPVFNWVRNNNNANDEFDIIIFNSDFSQRVLEIDVLGDVTSYTLTEAQAQVLEAAGVGIYRFVVVGTDTTTFATGPYWSGAEQLWLIPEPGTVALLAMGGLWLARRRKA